MSIIGDRIRQFAGIKGTTLKGLAKQVGTSPQQLQQYVSGKQMPGAGILQRFEALGCDINWLLGSNRKSDFAKIGKLEERVRALENKLNQIKIIMEE